MEVGKGTFGEVIAKDGKAIKKFKRLDHLIQEAFITLYMNDSPYTIKILGYRFETRTMDSELWKTDLRTAIRRLDFTDDEKMKIFRELLCGMCHLQSRHVTHSDFKPSNILINTDKCDVCIADFGLSSIHKYAKTSQTAPGYRSMEHAAEGTHDMFGLAVSMAELFGTVRLTERLTARELRRKIRNNVRDKKIARALERMCPDNPADAWQPSEVLKDIYNESAELPFEAPKSFVTTLTPEIHTYLHDSIEHATNAAGIERGYRCYQCLVHYLDNPENEKVSSYMYPLYIGVMMMIFSAVFGTPGFAIPQVMKLTKDRHTKAEVYRVLYNLFRDTNMMRLAMMPSQKV